MESNSSFPDYKVEMFAFEANFDQPEFFNWTLKYWTRSIWYSLVYVCLIFYGRHYMSKREKFELRLPLILWSSGLAVFSIFGAIRTVPELLHFLGKYGFEGSVCSTEYLHGNTGFWVYAFTMSKLYELGDTAFIVLRKQPLMFLHWYHHITVMIYVWFTYTEDTAPGRWFMVMNFTVHSVMYTYYALRAMRIRVPRQVNICITAMQISQMIMGVVVTVSSFRYKIAGHNCPQSRENLIFAAVMYSSYLFLFCQFFYSSYVKPKPKSSASSKHNEKSHHGKEANRYPISAGSNGVSVSNGFAQKTE